MPSTRGTSSVSVIIPTMNRFRDLERCLRSIAMQSRLPDEVIVVDDGEVDVRPLGRIVETAGIRFTYEKKIPEKRGPCASRNLGIRLASGDLLIFLDDDTELDPDYVKAYVEILETDKHQRIGGLSGAQRRYRGDVPVPLSRALGWEEWASRFFLLASSRGGRVLPSGFRSSLLDPGYLDSVEFLQGGNMVLRRRVVEEFRFDESLDRFGGYALGDDVMFSYPVGRRYALYATGKARLKHFRSPGGRPDPYEMNVMYVVHQWRFLRETMKGGLFNVLAYWYAISGLIVIRGIQLARRPDRRRRSALSGVFGGIARILRGMARSHETLGLLPDESVAQRRDSGLQGRVGSSRPQ